MSTRWYPLYQKGNPQLRVFLPNFWLKLVKPKRQQPPNIVQFHCSMEMTQYDVQNYLEKIYNVPVIEVRTRINAGRYKRGKTNHITKEDDVKVAYVVLPKEQTFTFPDLFMKDKNLKDEENSIMDQMKKSHQDFLQRNNKPGLPGWYNI